MQPGELSIAWTEDGERHKLKLTQLTEDRGALIEWCETDDDRHIVGECDVFDVAVDPGRSDITYVGP